MSSGFREIVDPNLGRTDPVQWERRHQYSVHAVAPDVYQVTVWDAPASALRTCTLRTERLSPYFRIRANVDQTLAGLGGAFDANASLAVERARMQSAIADRIHVAHRYAQGDTRIASTTRQSAAADLDDFLEGIRLIARHDLLSMFAHPRVFHAPSLASAEIDDDSPIAAPQPLSPRDMVKLFTQFRSVASGSAHESALALAEHRGANFLSVDNGRSWLRLRLDAVGTDPADAMRFLKSVVDCSAGLDALVRDVAQEAQREVMRAQVEEDHQRDLLPTMEEGHDCRPTMR
jgi:hypothetical protein